MKIKFCHILLVFCLVSVHCPLSSQTPYDACAPEMYRPMIHLDAESDVRSWHEQVQADSTLYVVVVDTENSMVMLYNHTCDILLASAPLDWNTLMWLSVDPLHDKNISESPYIYCSGNPINYIDPTGLYTNVTDNGDGTYTTHSGEPDNNLRVYVVDRNGNRTGQVIGQTLTPYTFFYDDDSFVQGAIIDLNDYSGQEFLDYVTIDYPAPVFYGIGALPKLPNDFKNQAKKKYNSNKEKFYRAMPINLFDGNGTRIATARDIGNYAAGYVAGSTGISWDITRLMFDVVDVLTKDVQNITLYNTLNYLRQPSLQEPNVSVSAQFEGYQAAYNHIGKYLK